MSLACYSATRHCCMQVLRFKTQVIAGVIRIDFMISINQAKQIVEDKNLFGVMNDTKWQAVYEIFQDPDLPLLYRSKTIDGEVFPEDHLRFDIREVFPQYFSSLQWLEIHSKEVVADGGLLPPRINDHTAVAIELANKAKARFTVTDYGIKIWGYIKVGENIEFYKNV